MYRLVCSMSLGERLKALRVGGEIDWQIWIHSIVGIRLRYLLKKIEKTQGGNDARHHT
jgi:hypothetical protein